MSVIEGDWTFESCSESERETACRMLSVDSPCRSDNLAVHQDARPLKPASSPMTRFEVHLHFDLVGLASGGVVYRQLVILDIAYGRLTDASERSRCRIASRVAVCGSVNLCPGSILPSGLSEGASADHGRRTFS